MKKPTISTLALGCILAGSAFVADVALDGGLLIKDADARIGRPLTPVSYAGLHLLPSSEGSQGRGGPNGYPSGRSGRPSQPFPNWVVPRVAPQNRGGD